MTDDYHQTTVAGSSYVRGRSLYFENPLGAAPSLLIRLEEVINLADRQVTRDAGEFIKTFDDMSVSFPLRDPSTNDVIEGASVTYGHVFQMLFSAFWHLAEEHDATAPGAAP
jgi:hypothetical protein